MASRKEPYFQLLKVLFTNKLYKKLPNDAKILYSFFTARASWSEENGWMDNNRHVYIIYTIDQICNDIGCKRDKAMRLLKSLESAQLIGRKKRGGNRPDLIYVYPTVTGESPKESAQKRQEPAGEQHYHQKEKHTDQQRSEKSSPRSRKSRYHVVEKNAPIKSSHKKPSTYNLSIGKDEIDRRREEIKDRIGYESLLADYKESELNSVVETIIEASLNNASMTIGRTTYPAAYVNDRYAQLTRDQVAYALLSIEQQCQGSRIRNHKSYLQTTLFNAPATYSFFERQIGMI